MRKRLKKEVTVEIKFCNICKYEVTVPPNHVSGARRRLEMVNGLFKITDFDAHEKCINSVIRAAFKQYL